MKKDLVFIPQIDGLRFIAVLGVMINHWVAHNFTGTLFLSNIPFGTGVNLFYVLSGFLITFILLSKKESISQNKTSFWKEVKNFYAKRTLRIFPIYYLLILLLCIFNYQEIKLYLVAMLTYTSNWYMVLNDKFIGHETHLWSLAVEEQFYLIWPFCMFLVPKNKILLTIIVFILIGFISKFYFMYFSPHYMAVNGATMSCFDSLGFGALIAYNRFTERIKINLKYCKWLLWGSILLYIALFINPGYLSNDMRYVFFNTATSVIYFWIILIASENGFNGFWKAILENKTVLYFGKISYGMYLYHNLMGKLFFSGMNTWFPAFKTDSDLFIIYFLMLVVISTISWYLIEKPLLSLKTRFQ